MSTLPGNHNGTGPPGHPGGSNHAGGGINGLYHAEPVADSIEQEESPNNGNPSDGAANHGHNLADNGGAESDVKSAGPRSGIRQNTPASTEGSTPAPAAASGPPPAYIASAVAALARQAYGNQASSSTSVDGGLNRVNGVGTPSTAGGSPSPSPPPPVPSLPVSQPGPASAGPPPYHPNQGPGDSVDQAENAGYGATQPGPSSSLSGTSGTSGPIPHQNPPAGAESQSPSGGVHVQEGGQDGSTGQTVPTPGHSQVPVTLHQNNPFNQQIGPGAVTTNLSTSQAGFHPQQQPGHGAGSSSLQLGHTLQSSHTSSSTPASGQPVAQAPRSLSMNPIAPTLVPGPEQPNTSQSFTLPTWQPDAEVTNCPICGVRFGMFLRRHHCRKCGRVVCDACSPHRITIPHPYIVRPPGDPGPALQFSYPGVERGIADFTSIGGGERVRLCNPCVPDPNTTPPRPQQSSQPIIVDGRSSRTRSSNEPFGNYSADARPYPLHPHDWGFVSRNRSATIGHGRGQDYVSFTPYPSSSSQYPTPFARNQAALSHHRVSSNGLMFSPHIDRFGGRFRSTYGISGRDRPLPRTPTPEPEIPEEDLCPVCHRELPSRSLPNHEGLRETHINNCIASHSNYRGDQAMASAGTANHGTPPPRTTRRTRMFPYVATEKDTVGDVECTICLEEFRAGDQMARLECFCRFHRSCIDSWFVNHPGRCPVHQHDSFGY